MHAEVHSVGYIWYIVGIVIVIVPSPTCMHVVYFDSPNANICLAVY